MPIDAKDLITETLELASLPAVVMAAMEMLNNPHTSASDVGEIVSQDPALSIKLLKIVNSAFYGFPSQIDTIPRAITIVGTRELTDLILGSSAIQVFSRLPNRLINMQQFWEHSLYTGVVARILARHLRAPNTERCFVMGLLHDVGALILFRQKPDEAQRALDITGNSKVPLHIAEREVFGFDHGAVGAELMHSWNLPDSFVAATRYHHQPSAAQRYRLETAIIHLADIITGMVHPATTDALPPVLEPGAWELTGLSVEIMEAVCAEADTQFEEACAVILPRDNAA